jgi:hypothetical protein
MMKHIDKREKTEIQKAIIDNLLSDLVSVIFSLYIESKDKKDFLYRAINKNIVISRKNKMK